MAEIETMTQAVHKVAELIKEIDFAMMTTADAHGTLRSRPMSTQKKEFDGSLYFLADKNSHKIEELRQDAHVNLGYADPGKNRWVSVSGTGRISRDQELINELWTPFHKAWFPEGKEDPSIAVIRVDVDSAEYWDAPSSKMVEVVGFVKALVSGKQFRPGENVTVDLHTGSVENTKERNRK